MAKVYVDFGIRKKLEERFKCNPITIRRALRGDTNTPLAHRIRAAAINEFGGTEQTFEKVVIKN